MKRILPLLLGMFFALLAFPAAAQDEDAPIEYTERVPADNYGIATLHARAADWVDHHFAYGPKTNFVSDAAAGTVSVLGTIKLKPVDSKGQPLERTARFEFNFKATEQGYTYSVSNFKVIPDAQQPGQLVNFDAYLSLLRAEKNNDKNKNDRRVRAQANALASEIAMSFRSYMNQIPTAEDGSVGLPASESAGN
ncbi:DUF4468 domain-containing protein [Hymenobacter sp. 15J16-1T3B]|uniref:DUF4468 domain-containing protein n=1 Tax=Hymenobacter sp. 15J16-1T3B TaxID=2886941 RepID=UPI001D11D382|nr:DUF4468 domain-containing protein [Hymenobacter sp. 15J16-1T3B]MCC3156627.1 DUF4468 domain-containing protein [Hymenobacter sp. 15J16-1T3B]